METVTLSIIMAWSSMSSAMMKKKISITALSLSAHHRIQTMQSREITLMVGRMFLISRLRPVTDAAGSMQQSSDILHPSIGAVFFDVAHLVDLMSTLQLIRILDMGNFTIGSWAPMLFETVGFLNSRGVFFY